jgi:hypothetical protein
LIMTVTEPVVSIRNTTSIIFIFDDCFEVRWCQHSPFDSRICGFILLLPGLFHRYTVCHGRKGVQQEKMGISLIFQARGWNLKVIIIKLNVKVPEWLEGYNMSRTQSKQCPGKPCDFAIKPSRAGWVNEICDYVYDGLSASLSASQTTPLRYLSLSFSLSQL